MVLYRFVVAITVAFVFSGAAVAQQVGYQKCVERAYADAIPILRLDRVLIRMGLTTPPYNLGYSPGSPTFHTDNCSPADNKTRTWNIPIPIGYEIPPGLNARDLFESFTNEVQDGSGTTQFNFSIHHGDSCGLVTEQLSSCLKVTHGCVPGGSSYKGVFRFTNPLVRDVLVDIHFRNALAACAVQP